MNKKYTIFMILLILFLSGCTYKNPVGAFKLSGNNLNERKMQSREFNDVTEESILSASAALFQDMGYNIVESETRLGVITASKEVDATNAVEATIMIISILSGSGSFPINNKQQFTTTVVILPRENTNTFIVRMTMQQVIFNTDGRITSLGVIKSGEIYNIFFDKLKKAVFLEKNS